jgi:hypothetical protein
MRPRELKGVIGREQYRMRIAQINERELLRRAPPCGKRQGRWLRDKRKRETNEDDTADEK